MRFLMKQHEREYFVSRIRSGKYRIKFGNKALTIKSPTLEDEYFINEAFYECYDKCLLDGVKTQDQTLEWMIKNGMWSEEKDEQIEGIKKDADKLRIKIYENANNSSMKEAARAYLRRAESELSKLNNQKNKYYQNTAEGVSYIAKLTEMLKRCTFIKDEIYDFGEIPVDRVSSLLLSQFLSDSQTRELARNEPWRSVWALKDSNCFKLFDNEDRELFQDQKAILVWSRMYDNVQESMDCPSDDIIEDDDALDGWFLVQKEKRDKERTESEVKNMNSKISNSQEIFIVANSKEDAQRIHNMNSTSAKMTKMQRNQQIKKQGSVDQIKLNDEQLKLRNKSNQEFKKKFGR